MSYVRWSTPIKLPDGVSPIVYFTRPDNYRHLPTSDFYIYDHVGGFVSVNVAGNRGPNMPIQHPAAGETFEFADMAEAIEKVEELIAQGFLAPDYLIEAMQRGDG